MEHALGLLKNNKAADANQITQETPKTDIITAVKLLHSLFDRD